MSISLATELEVIRRQTHILHQEREETEFAENVRQAKQIAEEMIAHLPAFLKGIASTPGHGSCAFLVTLNAYRPWDFEWPRRKTRPAHVTNLSTRQCREYLFGVPQHLALWALKQGLTVRIGYGTALPDWNVFGIRHNPFGYKQSEGIIAQW